MELNNEIISNEFDINISGAADMALLLLLIW